MRNYWQKEGKLFFFFVFKLKWSWNEILATKGQRGKLTVVTGCCSSCFLSHLSACISSPQRPPDPEELHFFFFCRELKNPKTKRNIKIVGNWFCFSSPLQWFLNQKPSHSSQTIIRQLVSMSLMMVWRSPRLRWIRISFRFCNNVIVSLHSFASSHWYYEESVSPPSNLIPIISAWVEKYHNHRHRPIIRLSLHNRWRMA